MVNLNNTLLIAIELSKRNQYEKENKILPFLNQIIDKKRGLARSRDKLKSLYYHYQSFYGHQTLQYCNLL